MVKLAAFPKGFFHEQVTRRMPISTWLELAVSLDVDGVELYPAILERFDEPYPRQLAFRLGPASLLCREGGRLTTGWRSGSASGRLRTASPAVR